MNIDRRILALAALPLLLAGCEHDFSGMGPPQAASFGEPSRQTMNKAIPTATQLAPGMMKAARHEMRSVSTPAISGATARPSAPYMPLAPSARPRLTAVRTSQAMPTG